MKLNPEEAKKILTDLAFDDEKVPDTKTFEALRCGVQALTEYQKAREKPDTEKIKDFLLYFPFDKPVYAVCAWGVENRKINSYQVFKDVIYAMDCDGCMIGDIEDIYRTEEEAMKVWKEKYGK